jgi:hypothetical protein
MDLLSVTEICFQESSLCAFTPKFVFDASPVIFISAHKGNSGTQPRHKPHGGLANSRCSACDEHNSAA